MRRTDPAGYDLAVTQINCGHTYEMAAVACLPKSIGLLSENSRPLSAPLGPFPLQSVEGAGMQGLALPSGKLLRWMTPIWITIQTIIMTMRMMPLRIPRTTPNTTK